MYGARRYEYEGGQKIVITWRMLYEHCLKSSLDNLIICDTKIVNYLTSNMIRVEICRRPDYRPAGPNEEFIVPLLRQHIERALATYAAPAPPQGRVLDVGCGRQPFRQILEAIGYSYIGMDTQQNPEGTADVICPIDEPLPVELTGRGSFDFILCTEVMEHVADWDVAFKNLVSLLTQGGRLLITCPYFYHLHEEPYDFWRPTLHALNYFASRVGLKTLQQEAAGNAWDILGTILGCSHPVPASSRLLDRGVTRLVRLSHRWLFEALRRRHLQRMTQLQSTLYMSNIVVFERQ